MTEFIRLCLNRPQDSIWVIVRQSSALPVPTTIMCASSAAQTTRNTKKSNLPFVIWQDPDLVSEDGLFHGVKSEGISDPLAIRGFGKSV